MRLVLVCNESFLGTLRRFDVLILSSSIIPLGFLFMDFQGLFGGIFFHWI
jgi:hypothetical protein